ncbi:MAG TPA: hypothetical protein DCZ97_15900 [Syntrophus sp. (in: bacteria)]|nr:hypothetical protein [Syntrophus sp. (in: bacteria)]
MPDYYILDERPDSDGLAVVPTQLWLLLTLEVAISDAHGESLLLTYPSYTLEGREEDGPLVEGYWTPPFFGFPVDLGFRAPDTVGAVRMRFQEHENAIDMRKSIDELAYVMGLPNPEIVNTGSFIELKRSPRSPELWKCYKIQRFTCTKLGPRGRRNLADPECRKGYVFLPLNDMDSVLTSRQSERHGRTERCFLSKPLISNLDFVLGSPERLSNLRANAIPLAPKDFRHEEEGLLICTDLAGYGTACRYAVEHMHSFTETGVSIATYFRESVACLFYRFLSQIGISQVHTAGDGLIAAIPKRHFENAGLDATLHTFFQQYRTMLHEVEKFNHAIGEESKKVGSRLALHYGSYRYGRIALSRSISSDFDGAAIIEVARLEGALREHIKGPLKASSQRPGKKRAVGHSHTFICSKNLNDVAGDSINACPGLSFDTEIPIRIKEFESQARVFTVSVDEGVGIEVEHPA